MNHYDLKNKKILITGANGQLGRSLALVLLNQEAFVYATDIQKEMEKGLVKKIKNSEFKNFKYMEMDVTSEKSVEKAENLIKGNIDVLINNAGVAVFTPFEERTIKEIDKVIDVNLKGTILCSKIFSKKMIRRKAGKIINIGSMYGIVPPDKRIYGDSGRNSSEIYGATKAGVIQLTKYLATYLGEFNITVNAISPGGIFNYQKKFFVDNYIRKNPLGRMAKEEDMLGIICFLSSDDSNYITGQNIAVDGGFTLNQ